MERRARGGVLAGKINAQEWAYTTSPPPRQGQVGPLPGGDPMSLPDLFVSGLDERGHFTFKQWRPPAVEDFATPSDLARIITAFRGWVQANSCPHFQPITRQGAVSEQGLGRLLLLAYQASFYTDEGRSTRARIFVPDADRQARLLRINHRFTSPKQLAEPK